VTGNAASGATDGIYKVRRTQVVVCVWLLVYLPNLGRSYPRPRSPGRRGIGLHSAISGSTDHDPRLWSVWPPALPFPIADLCIVSRSTTQPDPDGSAATLLGRVSDDDLPCRWMHRQCLFGYLTASLYPLSGLSFSPPTLPLTQSLQYLSYLRKAVLTLGLRVVWQMRPHHVVKASDSFPGYEKGKELGMDRTMSLADGPTRTYNGLQNAGETAAGVNVAAARQRTRQGAMGTCLMSGPGFCAVYAPETLGRSLRGATAQTCARVHLVERRRSVFAVQPTVSCSVNSLMLHVSPMG
jgi:hypothetical protein